MGKKSVLYLLQASYGCGRLSDLKNLNQADLTDAFVGCDMLINSAMYRLIHNIFWVIQQNYSFFVGV